MKNCTDTETRERTPLWADRPPLWNPASRASHPSLEWFPGDAGLRPCVVVFPGGGYNRLAPHEGRDYALFWNARGYHAVVVHYRTQWAENQQALREGPLFDAVRAMRLVRNEAAQREIDPERVAVIGSSAGGHLAACLAVHGDQVQAPPEDNLSHIRATPDALLLCYAVITAGDRRHSGSFHNLVGRGSEHEPLRQYFSAEKQVHAGVPPAFIWHTASDSVVPAENALLFAGAMRAVGRPFSLHVFPEGAHGLGLATTTPQADAWPCLAAEWLHQLWTQPAAGTAG